MKIAIHGLGRMGMQIAEKLATDGHDVIAHNRSKDKIDTATGFGAIAAYTKQDVIDNFGSEQHILWLMLPDTVVEEELAEWLTLLPTGSIIVDGGNSDFRITQQHDKQVGEHGSSLLDVGTSGGVWGFQNGFSMMVGGDDAAFQVVTPILTTLAAPKGAFDHFGPSGSGQYVKMVHNAIEYGMMEALGEGYRMLHEGPYENIDLAAAGEVWQHSSVITSWLNELCRDVVRENPTLEGIEGSVAENGETRWTLEIAKEKGIELPAIQSAFDVRIASQTGSTNFATKMVAAMRNKFGGHALNIGSPNDPPKAESKDA